MKRRALVSLVSLVTLVVLVAAGGDAWARAGSGGSRGTRSYSTPAPARPSSPMAPSNPTSPSRSFNQPQPSGGFGRSMFGGIMGGIAGFALGGLIGSMLFGHGGMGMGGLGGGIGLMEILLVAGGLFLLYKFWASRRAQTPAPAYAGGSAYGGTTAAQTGWSGGGGGAPVVMETPAAMTDLERGLAHIRQMDPGFDEVQFARTAADAFRAVQAAVVARDVATVGGQVTAQMLVGLGRQCDDLRQARRTNRLERVDVERAEVTEAWQETGNDYATTYLSGTMLDWVQDDATGAVVEGSRTEPQRFEEYWTFVRPVGNNPWKLTAIQTG